MSQLWHGFDPTRVNPRRSFILMGIGGIIGLILAGYALFTAKGTSTLIVPDEDVALINQQPIARSDYILQLNATYSVTLSQSTPEQRQKVLDSMIREELFVQRGRELDVAATDPDVRSAMVNAVEQMAAADAITAQPSDAKLRAYYQSHQSAYSSEGTMTVQDLVCPAGTGDAIAQASPALNAEGRLTDFTTRVHCADSRKVNGQEFYFAAKIHLGDALFDLARPLADGAFSAPSVQPEGIHVLYMVKNTPPVPLGFDGARDLVLRDYRTEAVKHLTQDDETFFRKRANVLIAPDLR